MSTTTKNAKNLTRTSEYEQIMHHNAQVDSQRCKCHGDRRGGVSPNFSPGLWFPIFFSTESTGNRKWRSVLMRYWLAKRIWSLCLAIWLCKCIFYCPKMLHQCNNNLLPVCYTGLKYVLSTVNLFKHVQLVIWQMLWRHTPCIFGLQLLTRRCAAESHDQYIDWRSKISFVLPISEHKILQVNFIKEGSRQKLETTVVRDRRKISMKPKTEEKNLCHAFD